jgi:hypothetical protein
VIFPLPVFFCFFLEGSFVTTIVYKLHANDEAVALLTARCSNNAPLMEKLMLRKDRVMIDACA